MAHCTKCGSSISNHDAFCGACGARVAVDTIQSSNNSQGNSQADTSTLMGMAKTAELGGNNSEALGYYNRVLEVDPTNPDAWIGKGRSAAWQSTLANLRVAEAVIAFQHAIANAESARDVVTDQAVDELNKVIVALYGLSRRHLEEFASSDGVWPSYLGQVAEMLDALEQAAKWSPNNQLVLENIVHLTKDNIEGVSYRDPIHNAPGLLSISPEYEASLREKMNSAVSKLRELNRDYTAPTVEKKSADACFVVTATMGNFHHPRVRVLRRFRDLWIRHRTGGPAFIRWYYRNGPSIAAWIGKKKWRRHLSFVIIVWPASYLAKLLIEKR